MFYTDLVFVLACLGAVACGAVLGWTANISTSLEDGDLNDIKITKSDQGWIGSYATLGALISCIPTGILCDYVGRKITMLILVVPFLIGWILIILSNSIGMIFAGRMISGLAGGAFCVAAPLYASEIAEKSIRGALGSYFQLLLTVGILLAYLVSAFVDVFAFTIFCAIVPIVFGVAFVFQPETPVYNMKKGNEKSARAILIRLRGKDYDVDGELRDIKMALEEAEKNKVSLTEAFRSVQAKKATLITFALMFFQQLSGINAVIFYAGTIFKEAGTSLKPEHATILVGCFQVIATFVSSIVIDKLGRRILLMGSDVLMAIAGILLGIYFTMKERNLVDEETLVNINFLPIFALSMFIIVFSLGFGPIPWMIASEISPNEIKSTLSSVGGTLNWFLAFIVTKFYGDLTEALHTDVTFYIFSIISIVGTVFVYFVVPETKGKSLEQIQDELGGNSSHNRTVTSGIDNVAYSH